LTTSKFGLLNWPIAVWLPFYLYFIEMFWITLC